MKDLLELKSRIILANDLSALPVAVWGAAGRPIIFDAHEYYPGQFSRTPKTLHRRMYDSWVLKKFLSRCERLITVSSGIKRLYRRLYNGEIDLVLNAPDFVEMTPQKPSGTIKFVHHGVAVRGRNLDILLEAFARLPKGNTFDLYLMGEKEGYLKELRQMASNIEGVAILPPVQMTKITETLNKYDVGLYSLPPISENQKWALPNKIFEFVQARLALVIGPSCEMADLVRQYDIGIVCAGFDVESLASAMRSLTQSKIIYYKGKSDLAARELSSTPQNEIIRRIVSSVVEKTKEDTM